MNKEENINLFLKEKGFDPEALVLGEQVHGRKVEIVGKRDGGGTIKRTDGLITSSEDIILGVLVADCLPLSFSSKELCGILHVGWKGLFRGIIEEGMKKVRNLGINPEVMQFEVGPGIGVCHFEVKEDLLKKMRKVEGEREMNNFLQKREGGRIFLDLKELTKRRIEELGGRNIKISTECTFCEENLFSYRRDREVCNMLALQWI